MGVAQVERAGGGEDHTFPTAAQRQRVAHTKKGVGGAPSGLAAPPTQRKRGRPSTAGQSILRTFSKANLEVATMGAHKTFSGWGREWKRISIFGCYFGRMIRIMKYYNLVYSRGENLAPPFGRPW